jgi:hypothetical protein
MHPRQGELLTLISNPVWVGESPISSNRFSVQAASFQLKTLQRASPETGCDPASLAGVGSQAPAESM